MGYILDKRESSRNSIVMRKDHDKIIISRKPDGHYTYWSPRDDKDHGTIVDLLQRRKGLSLGGVRKELRAWTGLAAPAQPETYAMTATVKDLESVRKRFAAMQVAYRHPYLEEERGIPAEILQHHRFAGYIKQDRYAAAVFPHFGADGQVSGYELKNKSKVGTWTGFSPGGRKGMFLSNTKNSDRRLVITESGTDALSYAAIFGDLDVARYGSIGGKPTSAQRAVIRAAMLDMPGGSEIVAATDNDDAGRQLAELMKEIFDDCGRADLTFRREEPVGGKDWNDVLLAKKSKRPLPVRPEEPHVA
jgi:hypothetical protein